MPLPDDVKVTYNVNLVVDLFIANLAYHAN